MTPSALALTDSIAGPPPVTKLGEVGIVPLPPHEEWAVSFRSTNQRDISERDCPSSGERCVVGCDQTTMQNTFVFRVDRHKGPRLLLRRARGAQTGLGQKAERTRKNSGYPGGETPLHAVSCLSAEGNPMTLSAIQFSDHGVGLRIKENA
jgi:hypothetical protein